MGSPIAALPPGVSRNSRPCWVPVMPDGTAWESEDGVPHFGTQNGVQGYIDEVIEDEPKPVPAPMSTLCLNIRALCGYWFDEEDEGVVCFGSVEEITKVVKAWGWTQSAAGWSCSADCTECAEAVAAADTSWAPVPIATGQQPLIGADETPGSVAITSH
jgi:hypothetical protein